MKNNFPTPPPDTIKNQLSKKEKKIKKSKQLDKALEDTFPASDSTAKY